VSGGRVGGTVGPAGDWASGAAVGGAAASATAARAQRRKRARRRITDGGRRARGRDTRSLGVRPGVYILQLTGGAVSAAPRSGPERAARNTIATPPGAHGVWRRPPTTSRSSSRNAQSTRLAAKMMSEG
jgi:hypothetical protein